MASPLTAAGKIPWRCSQPPQLSVVLRKEIWGPQRMMWALSRALIVKAQRNKDETRKNGTPGNGDVCLLSWAPHPQVMPPYLTRDGKDGEIDVERRSRWYLNKQKQTTDLDSSRAFLPFSR